MKLFLTGKQCKKPHKNDNGKANILVTKQKTKWRKKRNKKGNTYRKKKKKEPLKFNKNIERGSGTGFISNPYCFIFYFSFFNKTIFIEKKRERRRF